MNRWWNLSADQQTMLRDILAHCPTGSSPPSFCALLQPIERKHQRRTTKTQVSEPASDQDTGPPPQNSKTTKYTPSGAASTSSGGVGSTPLPPINATPGTPGAMDTQGGQASTLVRSGLNELLWITFGVEGSQSTPEVDQIGSDDQTFDQIFIKELRSRHRRLRGWMRLYLSIWRLHYWEFVKVSHSGNKLAPLSTIY